MIDVAFLDELRARIPVSEVVGKRVRLAKAGREWKGMSPFNKERTPSFFVNDAKRFWHDFSSGKSGDIFTFIMEIEGVTFPEAVVQVAAMAGTCSRSVPSTTSLPEFSTSSGEWLQLWDEAEHPVGTCVNSYLRRRNVPLLDETAGEAIRFHPACKFGLRRVPCMLALVRNIRTNAPQAIHRTALDTAGTKIEIGSTDRMMLGAVGGGAVKLSPDDTVTTCLGIGEGIESTLALRLAPQFGASPVWAVLSAGQIEKFPVLPGIECLWIAVDHDKNSTGQRAAMACSARWTAAGQEVFRVIPKALGKDSQRPRPEGVMTADLSRSEYQIEHDVPASVHAEIPPNAGSQSFAAGLEAAGQANPPRVNGGIELRPQGPRQNPEQIAPRIKLIPFDDLKPGTEPEYLIRGLLPRGGLIVVWGPPKCGKSFWIMDAMLHVALGWEYRGSRVHKGAVVYCAFEGQSGYGKRAEAFRLRKLAEHRHPVPFYLVATPMNFVADHLKLITAIRAQLGDDAKPATVVLDTLNRSLAGSESDDKDMGAYMKAADTVRDTFECAVIIVHHCGVNVSRPRGHTSLTCAIDAQIAVTRDGTDNVIAKVEWMKDGEEGKTVVSRLEVVNVEIDIEAQPVTSCVVLPVEDALAAGPAKAKPASMSKAAQTALRALKQAIDERGEAAPTSNHIPCATRVTTVNRWREYAYGHGISRSEKPRARQAAFHRACEHLCDIKAVMIWDEYVWLAQ